MPQPTEGSVVDSGGSPARGDGALRLRPLAAPAPEDAESVCGICHETVSKPTSWVMRAPCCGSLFHAECMEGSIFLPSRKFFYCARCVEPRPPSVTTLVQKKQAARERYLADRAGARVRNEDALDMLLEHLKRTAENGLAASMTQARLSASSPKGGKRKGRLDDAAFGKRRTELFERLRQRWDAWRALAVGDPAKLAFFQEQRPKITYSTLVSLGWTLENVYTAVTDRWDGLVALGFTMKHLEEHQRQMDALVALYDVDARTLRRSYGKSKISVKNIKAFGAEALALLGFSAHHLCTVCSLKKAMIPGFRALSMDDWIERIELRPVHVKLLRIKHEDFDRLLAPRHWNAARMAQMMERYLRAAPPAPDTDVGASKAKRRAKRRSLAKSASERDVPQTDDQFYFQNILLLPTDSPRKPGRGRSRHSPAPPLASPPAREDAPPPALAPAPRPPPGGTYPPSIYYFPGSPPPPEAYPYFAPAGPLIHRGVTYYPPTMNGSESTYRFDAKTSRGHWIQPRKRRSVAKPPRSAAAAAGKSASRRVVQIQPPRRGRVDASSPPQTDSDSSA